MQLYASKLTCSASVASHARISTNRFCSAPLPTPPGPVCKLPAFPDPLRLALLWPGSPGRLQNVGWCEQAVSFLSHYGRKSKVIGLLLCCPMGDGYVVCVTMYMQVGINCIGWRHKSAVSIFLCHPVIIRPLPQSTKIVALVWSFEVRQCIPISMYPERWYYIDIGQTHESFSQSI